MDLIKTILAVGAVQSDCGNNAQLSISLSISVFYFGTKDTLTLKSK